MKELKTPAPRSFDDEPPSPLLTFGFPKDSGQILPGILGLPVEKEARPIKEPKFLTYSIGVFVLVHLFGTFYGLNSFVLDYGFIADQGSRNNGLNFITAFFMHGGWMHLIGNSYYLYHFGDDVEHELGFTQTMFLVFGAHCAGMLLEASLGGYTHLPVVGASAGLSGILGYYMIRMPKRRISYNLFMLVTWIHVPVLVAFLWKYFWEMILLGSGASTGIAHLAHFGGAAFGALFALYKKKGTPANRVP